MKKVLLGSLLVYSLVLVACGSNEESTVENSTTETGQETEVNADQNDEGEDYVSEMSFENGKLETDYMELTIDDTQIAHDNFEDEDGLIIWYTIENNSEDNIIPSDEFYSFELKQQDDTSEYDLTEDIGWFDPEEALFPTENEDGEMVDDETYDANFSKQEEFYDDYLKPADNDLLPGKSVQVATSVPLNNTDNPVSMKVYEDYPMETNETYNINLE